jgi:two-component system chemotaxis sensor kinase CheA
VALRFERLARQAVALGQRLDKAPLDVTIDDGRIRLDPERWVGFWAAMVHAVRNAVDHGVETSAERSAAGKPARATVTLAASHRDGHLVITLADDGRGIDWEAVRARAAREGLPAVTRADLVAALFADGLSTREVASDVSGRGIGLGALRAAITALDGTVDVTSSTGAGTRFEIRFPDASAELRPPTQPLRIVV